MQPDSEDKIDKQLVEVSRTVRLLVTSVQVLTRIVRAVRWSRVSVETAALQKNRAELGRATVTTTTTVEKDSDVVEATAPSLDQTTMREPIAVTTQNIHTQEKVIMMFYISQRSYLPFTASCWFDGRERKD